MTIDMGIMMTKKWLMECGFANLQTLSSQEAVGFGRRMLHLKLSAAGKAPVSSSNGRAIYLTIVEVIPWFRDLQEFSFKSS